MFDDDFRASHIGGDYPRPQFVRRDWASLDGPWRFAFGEADDAPNGIARRPESLTSTITVPFPPESAASGIYDTGYHAVLWYSRTVAGEDLTAAGHLPGRDLLIHFGAIDFSADVWVDGQHVARHEGGHTPFSVRITPDNDGFELTVRAEDEPTDLTQPRGKQDWHREPHVVWYHRTSGIWQSVWLESVADQYIQTLHWSPDLDRAAVTAEIELAHAPRPGTVIDVTIQHGADLLARELITCVSRRTVAAIELPALRNGQSWDEAVWTPENPTLIDCRVTVRAEGAAIDSVASYFGMRSIGTRRGAVTLNGRPYPLRGVLSQGYWPESHLAAPSREALRDEVELAKDLGFNLMRIHQKVEDPRLLYWADRLGLLVWVEMPSAYEFSGTATSRLLAEWQGVVERDRSHPCVMAWVPFNESWGIHQVAVSPRQQELVRSAVSLTRSLDDSRLVVSNDGWEHLGSDLFTIHDYENDAQALAERYGDDAAVARTIDGTGPSGKQLLVGTRDEASATRRQPVILSEFGGVAVHHGRGGDWGYATVSQEGLEDHLTALFDAVRAARPLAGWCYTQLADTAQETNGLVNAERKPKLAIDRIRAIVTGIPPRPAD